MNEKPLPMHQLAAFEASLRHMSFSRAARELNVQQPAVGRQVAALEADLGTRLFHRTKPRLTLTGDGQLLAEAVARGFDALRKGISDLRARQAGPGIVVNAAIGFTSFYLLPRMAEFQANHPETPVQIVTRDQDPEYDPEQCDAVVTFGTDGLPGQPAGLVVSETLVAVCSGEYLQGRGRLNRVALAQERLLHMTGAPYVGDWTRFLDGTGVSVPVPPQHDRFHSYMVYMRAIQNGMGIGIGWRPLVDDFLSAGSLILACDHHCKTDRGYFCSVTPRGASRAGAADFLSWITRQR